MGAYFYQEYIKTLRFFLCSNDDKRFIRVERTDTGEDCLAFRSEYKAHFRVGRKR